MRKINIKHFALLLWRYSCSAKTHPLVAATYKTQIQKLCELLPSGAGIDRGTQFDWDNSTPNSLIFTCSFHHMNDTGYYDGWTEHTITVSPSFTNDFELKITGKDRNDIKNHLEEVFNTVFTLNELLPV